MDHQVLSRHVDVKALEVDILDLAIFGEVNRGVPHFESLKPVAELLGQLIPFLLSPLLLFCSKCSFMSSS
jgi:hypothetical protein